MSHSRRYPPRWIFKTVLLALPALLAWTPAGNAAPVMGKDCVSCHKHLSKSGGRERLGPHKAEGVSPHAKPSTAVPASGSKGTNATSPAAPPSPGKRPTPRGNPAGTPGAPAPGKSVKQ